VNENEEQLGGYAGSNKCDKKTIIKDILYIICCLEQLFKYASIVTPSNLFWEFQVICEL